MGRTRRLEDGLCSSTVHLLCTPTREIRYLSQLQGAQPASDPLKWKINLLKSYWKDPRITRRLDSQSLKMDNKRRKHFLSLPSEVWSVRTLLPGRCRFDRRDQQKENIKVWSVSSLVAFGSSWNKRGSYCWCDPFDPLKHGSQSSSCRTRSPKFQVHLCH